MPADQPALSYQSGFGNEYATEAVPNALPQGRNSPQRAPLDLYPELISGTAFTAPRHENRRTWVYRRQPSVVAGRYQPYNQSLWSTGGDREAAIAPEPLRWNPIPFEPGVDQDFVDGMRTLVANGDAEAQTGMGSLVYLATKSMEQRAFVNADGEIRGAGERYRLRSPAGAHRRRGLHHARSLKALDQVRDGGWRQAGRGGKLDLRDLTIDPHRLDDAGRVGFAQRRLRASRTDTFDHDQTLAPPPTTGFTAMPYEPHGFAFT